MSQKLDVLVIGGGIVGTSVARELQAAGRQVTIIEKRTLAAGSSFANAGWVTPCFAMPLPQPGMFLKSIGWLLDNESPLHIKPQLNPTLIRWMIYFLRAMNKRQMLRAVAALTEISKYSLKAYEELARTSPTMSFEKRGLLMVSATDDGVKGTKLEMDLMAQQGVPGKWLERDELLAFEPALKPLVKGGVYFPEEAQVEPYPTVLAMAEEFKKLGGKILEQTEVFDFRKKNGRIEAVLTTQGELYPELVVLATGSWSNDIGGKLGVKLPILGGKGYSMNVPEGPKKPKHPIMILERKIAVTPRAGSVRLAGTLELVDQDFSISPNRVNAIRKGADEYLHLEPGAEPTSIWRGLRPCSPDGVPLIGYSKKVPNLFYNLGHQLLGLQSSPGSARLAADLITNRTPYVDPKPFRPERFE
jgi:D-amino-acid dehydrogenase